MRKANLKAWAAISVLLVVMLPGSVRSEGTYSGGDGTAGNPYQINDANDMNEVGAHPNDWDAHFVLTADIDLISYTGPSFPIIGNKANIFTGVFDGNDHIISNFNYTAPDIERIGLFGYLGNGGEIRDLGLINLNVDAGTYTHIAVGGLVGWNFGTVTNCYAEGTVTGKSLTGGLVGVNGGIISDSYAMVAVMGDAFVGGLVGDNSDTVINCYAVGVVTGGTEVGGLVGTSYGSISNCYAKGSVSGTDEVGGLAGQNLGSIINCYSAAEIVEKIYWTDASTDKVQRADTDGTNVEDIVTSGLTETRGITLDISAGKMYWTDALANKIKCANLDGTNVQELITSGIEWPTGIALDSMAGKMY